MANNILTKNTIIAISNIPKDVEIKEFCNKLRDFLKTFGKVIRIVFNDLNEDSYVVVKFQHEDSINELRNSLNSEVLNFSGHDLIIDEEKTIKQIKPKCKYIKVKEESDSRVLEITNIPNELKEENIIEIFEEHGKINFLDIVPTQYGTITAYAYYKNNDIAKNIKRLMNGGKIEKHKIEIELCSPITSCLCIRNINDFNTDNIKALVECIKQYGNIKELEIYEKQNCIYVNFEEVLSAVKLENEISHKLLNEFKELKVEFCIPIANYYRVNNSEGNNDIKYHSFIIIL